MADENTLPALDMPAGSYDVVKLDKALQAAMDNSDPAKRVQSVNDAITKANKTAFDHDALPDGFKRVKRKTTFNKGEPNEVTIEETVIVADVPPVAEPDAAPVVEDLGDHEDAAAPAPASQE